MFALDNSYQEQADWTVQAYQMMKNWGWVGPSFLWNLNFRVVAHGTEREQWGIVNTDWSPLPAYEALKALNPSRLRANWDAPILTAAGPGPGCRDS